MYKENINNLSQPFLLPISILPEVIKFNNFFIRFSYLYKIYKHMYIIRKCRYIIYHFISFRILLKCLFFFFPERPVLTILFKVRKPPTTITSFLCALTLLDFFFPKALSSSSSDPLIILLIFLYGSLPSRI